MTQSLHFADVQIGLVPVCWFVYLVCLLGYGCVWIVGLSRSLVVGLWCCWVIGSLVSCWVCLLGSGFVGLVVCWLVFLDLLWLICRRFGSGPRAAALLAWSPLVLVCH